MEGGLGSNKGLVAGVDIPLQRLYQGKALLGQVSGLVPDAAWLTDQWMSGSIFSKGYFPTGSSNGSSTVHTPWLCLEHPHYWLR